MSRGDGDATGHSVLYINVAPTMEAFHHDIHRRIVGCECSGLFMGRLTIDRGVVGGRMKVQEMETTAIASLAEFWRRSC
jgi:hypothetical protein